MWTKTETTQAPTKFPVFARDTNCRRIRLYIQGERRLGRYLNDTPLALNEYIALRLSAAMLAKDIPRDAYFYDYEGRKVFLLVVDRYGNEMAFTDWTRTKAAFLCATEVNDGR